jgi:CRP-like cAMP-binding protein
MEAVCPAGRRRRISDIIASAGLDPLRNLMKVRSGIDRGQTIVDRTDLAHFTVLLEGVACFSTQHEDGGRQIYAFHYAGDFLGLHGFLFPPSAELSEVQALTGCCIGTIDRVALERQMRSHPTLGRALWRAAMTEASILRQRLLISRRPARQRVAHLLCEQLARLGIDKGVIPLSQIDIADAGGLSVVHTNRIFQELRVLGVLSTQRLIEVLNKERLHELAAFDGRYLELSASLSRWDLRIDD